MPGSLGAIIGSFKSAAAKRINELRDTRGAPVWQRNYYEHIVRNEKDRERIHQYIDANPTNWTRDEENPAMQQFTVTFYAASLAMIGFVKALLWWYASRNYRLIDRSLDPRRVARITRRSLIAPFVFLFSIVVASFNPLIAMWSWGLVGAAIFLTSSDTIGG